MGLIQSIKEWKLNKDTEKLRGLLKVLEERYQFNAYKVYTPNVLLASSKLNDTLIESLVWYSGDVAALMDLYKDTSRYPHMSGSFWNMVASSQRKVHAGLPNLIVSKMPTIIFGSGYQVKLKIYRDGVENEELTKKVNELKDILDEQLDLERKLMAAAEKESWSGHLGLKMSINENLSRLPIVEFFDRRYFDIAQQRGLMKAIIFKRYFTIDKSNYLMKEIHMVVENKPAIQYEVYLVNNNREVQVNIGAAMEYLPELKELNLDENGRVIYEGLEGWLAFEKPNVIAKNLINENPYGKSDITAVTTYDAIDEIVTQMVNEIRDNRTRIYFPEAMIPKDENGNFIKFDAMITNFVKTASDHDQNGKNEITSTFIQDKTEQHYLKYKTLITNACNQAEMSPISLGLVGMDGLNNGSETLRERVKTTIEMRDKKVALWKNFLRKMYMQLILVYDYMSSDKTIIEGYPKMNITYKDIDCDVMFNDYMHSSQKELIETWGMAKSGGLASIDMAVRKIHKDDLTEEEIQEEINNIRFESGMSIDTPDTLQLLSEAE